MSTVYVKLNIGIELYSYAEDALVASGTTSRFDIEHFVNQLNNEIDLLVKSLGFDSSDLGMRKSRRNGGYSLYQTYLYPGDTSEIRLVIDVRVSNHPSKPDLKTSRNQRIQDMKNKLNTSNVDVLDIYCKEHNQTMYIYFGKSTDYAKPVTSVEQLKSILTGKLTKLINKHGV